MLTQQLVVKKAFSFRNFVYCIIDMYILYMIYYVGIMFILQTYNNKKRLEE